MARARMGRQPFAYRQRRAVHIGIVGKSPACLACGNIRSTMGNSSSSARIGEGGHDVPSLFTSPFYSRFPGPFASPSQGCSLGIEFA